MATEFFTQVLDQPFRLTALAASGELSSLQ